MSEEVLTAPPAVASATESPQGANTAIHPPANPMNDWEKVRIWVDWACKFQRGSLACQVMAGFGLLGLHDQHQVQPGQPKKVFCQNGRILFDELIRTKLKLSTRTAYRWMAMARGLRDKYGSGLKGEERMRALLGTSPKDWTQYETELVMALADRMTDGKTAVDFMAELGLTKPPAPKLPANNPLPEAPVQREDRRWNLLERRLIAYEQQFEHLGVAVVKAQMESLTTALNVRKLWLEQREESHAGAK